MTDQQRNEFFNRKHEEICEMLLGHPNLQVTDEIECRIVDHNWSKGISFYDQPRIHENINTDTCGLREWQEQMRQNGGVIRKHVEGPLDPAVPDPIK